MLSYTTGEADATCAYASIERAAATSTVEALMYELRENGLPQFKNRNYLRRLGELSDKQVREVLRAGCLDCGIGIPNKRQTAQDRRLAWMNKPMIDAEVEAETTRPVGSTNRGVERVVA